jgi:protease-4
MINFLKKVLLPITAPIIFIQNHFKAVVLVVIVMLILIPAGEEIKQHNLSRVDLRGAIFSADEIMTKIRELEKNSDIKGVLLVVDSPGGAVSPSVEISAAIKRLNSVKPVVAYASGTMASGSYYSSIWAKKIIANPGSDIGSIGVIFQSPNYISSILMKKR